MIVADIRKHEMAERSDLFVQPRAGSDIVWLNAIAKYLIENGKADERFLQEKVNGRDEYVKSLTPYTLNMPRRKPELIRKPSSKWQR